MNEGPTVVAVGPTPQLTNTNAICYDGL